MILKFEHAIQIQI